MSALLLIAALALAVSLGVAAGESVARPCGSSGCARSFDVPSCYYDDSGELYCDDGYDDEPDEAEDGSAFLGLEL